MKIGTEGIYRSPKSGVQNNKLIVYLSGNEIQCNVQELDVQNLGFRDEVWD